MWKKKYKFKFVSFSHGTAKKNPDMVIREYQKLISDLDSEIQVLRIRDYRLNIAVQDYRVKDAFNDHIYKDTISVSALEVIKFYEEIQKEKSIELRNLALQKEMETELSIFKEKYKP